MQQLHLDLPIMENHAVVYSLTVMLKCNRSIRNDWM